MFVHDSDVSEKALEIYASLACKNWAAIELGISGKIEIDRKLHAHLECALEKSTK